MRTVAVGAALVVGAALATPLPAVVETIGASIGYFLLLAAVGAIPAELRDALIPRRRRAQESG